MFRCWDIGMNYSLKLQTSVSLQRKIIKAWFKNWQAQLIMRNLNFICEKLRKLIDHCTFCHFTILPSDMCPINYKMWLSAVSWNLYDDFFLLVIFFTIITTKQNDHVKTWGHHTVFFFVTAHHNFQENQVKSWLNYWGKYST